MRILGLDVGDKTIGVAVSDGLGITAQGVEVIRRTKLEYDLDKLAQIVDTYEAGGFVVGFPRNMNGSIGPRGELVQLFVRDLTTRFPTLQIFLWDERLSTVAAQRTLLEANVSRAKRRRVVDKLAAVIILQNYLDSKHGIS